MDLSERIIKYIESHHPISYSKIVQVAQGKGFNEYQVSQALDKVAQNKSISTKVRKEEIWYDLITITPVSTPTHTSWLSKNYPRPLHFEMPFPEIDMSWLFLKTKEERDAFKAEMSGRPVYMMNKKYAKK